MRRVSGSIQWTAVAATVLAGCDVDRGRPGPLALEASAAAIVEVLDPPAGASVSRSEFGDGGVPVRFRVGNPGGGTRLRVTARAAGGGAPLFQRDIALTGPAIVDVRVLTTHGAVETLPDLLIMGEILTASNARLAADEVRIQLR
jgi:hypothetical protein